MSEETTSGRDLHLENIKSLIRTSPAGSPFYFRQVNKDAKDASVLRFDKHFNPDLA